jgi:hypothetical protein
MSALAEGADRLVAKVALDLGGTLWAALPLPADEYEQDFITEASRFEFRQLLAKAQTRFIVAPDMQGLPPILGDDTATERELAYTRAGIFITIHSQLLLALLDGQPSPHPAGAFHMAKYCLEGMHPFIPLPEDASAAMETGWVIQIATPRLSTQESRIPVGTMVLRRRGLEDRFLTMPHVPSLEALNCLDAFNCDLSQSPPSLKALRDSMDSLGVAQATPSNTPGLTQSLFANADALAVRFQNRFKRSLQGIFILAMAAFTLFDLYSHIYFKHPFLLALFLGALLLAAGLNHIGVIQAHHRKYLDYRALAEGLRVQAVWNRVGLRQDAAAHYLSRQAGDLDWVRQALRVIQLDGGEGMATVPDPDLGLELAVNKWLQGQRDYQFKSAHQAHRKETGIHRASMACFVLGLALTSFLMQAQFLDNTFFKHFYHDGHHALITLIGLVLALSAFIHAYGQKRAYAEQTKQAQRMAELLTWGLTRVRRAIEQDQRLTAQALIFEIGKEALAENGDWVLLHRVRPLEIPKG